MNTEEKQPEPLSEEEKEKQKIKETLAQTLKDFGTFVRKSLEAKKWRRTLSFIRKYRASIHNFGFIQNLIHKREEEMQTRFLDPLNEIIQGLAAKKPPLKIVSMHPNDPTLHRSVLTFLAFPCLYLSL